MSISRIIKELKEHTGASPSRSGDIQGYRFKSVFFCRECNVLRFFWDKDEDMKPFMDYIKKKGLIITDRDTKFLEVYQV